MNMVDGSKRESGLELLRILAMLLIILCHVPRFYAGDVNPLSAMGLALGLLTNAGRVAVNLFLLIGVWFMVDREFRSARPLKLYLTVLCYAFPLTAVGWMTGHGVGAGDTLRCFLPMMGRPLWFVSAYLTLMLLSPFLEKVRGLSVAAHGRLVLLSAVFTCGVCTLPVPQLTYFGDTVWFVFVYLFMAWFRRSPLLSAALAQRRRLLLVGMAGYATLVWLSARPWSVSSFAGQCLFDFKTLPNFLVSLCVFLFFSGLRIGIVAWINALARPALAAYVVHQMPSFAPCLWDWLLPFAQRAAAVSLGGSLVMTACGVYALAAVLEAVRCRFVEPVLVRSRGFAWLCARIDAFYAPVIGAKPHSRNAAVPGGSAVTVSFVIPVYRTERYLARCLDSLVAQTDGDFEAIVVDDGSEAAHMVGADHRAARSLTEEIVARHDARFKYVRHDRNRSTFQAKATGAKAAHGDYIVPLDSDDYVLPDLVAALKEGVGAASRRTILNPQPSTLNPQPDVIVYQMVRECRGRTYPVKYNHPSCRCSGDEALEKLFSGRIFMPVCGKAIRREVFLKAYEELGVGPDFYLNFTDDLCWLVPILFKAMTVSFIDYPGYRYCRHDDSMTQDVMTPERLRELAEQSRRSVDTLIACARRLGRDERTIARIRAQLYPTIRWLMRDKGVSRPALAEAFGETLVAETEVWDAAAGGNMARLFRHLRVYGLVATIRQIAARMRVHLHLVYRPHLPTSFT